MKIKLIVGLGNPTAEYEHTRHNAGFWFLDELAWQWKAAFKNEKKFFGDVARVARPEGDVWLLKPDKDDDGDNGRWLKYGAFAATLVLFFLAEIGDKTQIATVLLAARYNDLAWVVSGSVLGLMLANVPVAYLGEKIMAKVPAAAVRRAACLLFCLLGVLTLAGGGIGLS